MKPKRKFRQYRLLYSVLDFKMYFNIVPNKTLCLCPDYIMVISLTLMSCCAGALHVFMSRPHGLHSTVDVLEMFLVPPLSLQRLQSSCKERMERYSK